MKNITDFVLFKTEKCPEPLCQCYQSIKSGKRVPEQFADCYDYHNDFDKKREPYTDIATLTLAYKPVQAFYNHDENGCLNEVELLYHPGNFKATKCEDCPGFFCPYYHTAQEKQTWDSLLRRDVSENNSATLSKEIKVDKPKFVSKGNEEGNRDRNEQDEERRHRYQEHEHKISLHDHNDFFEVVDYPVEEVIKREVEVVAEALIKEENRIREDQIEEDLKLAIEFQRQENEQMQKRLGNIERSRQENDQASQNTDFFLQRKSGNHIVYYEKKNVPGAHNNYPIGSIMSSEENNMNRKDEHIEQQEEKHQIGQIQYDGVREFKRVPVTTKNKIHKITHNGILSAQERKAFLPRSSVPFFYGKKKYVYGSKVEIHENRQNEFKCFRANQPYEDLLDKYVPGFLNSRGGTIYLGISDDGKSWGIKLDTKHLQDLVSIIERKFKRFVPPVQPDQYCIEACPVYDYRSKADLKDQFVLHIIIAQGDQTELYCNDRELCYIRKQASTILLQPVGFKDEMKARTKRHMARNLIPLMGEQGFDQCLKRQSKDDLLEIKRLLEGKLELIDSLLKEDKKAYNDLLRNLGLGKCVPPNVCFSKDVDSCDFEC